MERNIPSLLLFHLVLFVIPAPLCSAYSKVVYIPEPMTWMAAQNYCRTHYTDLVTIGNPIDIFRLTKYEGWIGLHNGSDGVWRWSGRDEQATFSNWNKGEPGNDESCAFTRNSLWQGDKCSHNHAFLCMYDQVILVQEHKTWEEALEHCRELQVVDSTEYDLVSLPEATDILIDSETKWLHRFEAWVGLHFLAGDWLWVSGEEVTRSNLPQCPVEQQYCGAIVYDMFYTQWKIINCTEERNFFCSRKP
uniref:C-type lectin domain-containing protein n=1 Tax=Monopterus albus TaxID=43700 RepID=A0A3Q3JWA4_MONAL|nr:uncharacterized protein LOC109955870 [Monopterus albus]